MNRFSVYATIFVCSAVLLTCITSCSNPLLRDPRLYNTNRNESADEKDLPSLSLSMSEAQKELFKTVSAGTQFDSDIFDTWLLKVSFDKNNVPKYQFFVPSDDREWKLTTSSNAEYAFDAVDEDKNTAQGGIPIRSMTVYQYRGKNPLVQSSSAYNKAPQLNRFYFYRFSGKAAGLIELDNYLAAVDTYSKFLFAYGKITSYTSAVGQYIPKKYQAVELFAEERPFYEYDPIGYVNEDGSVILYQEYYTEMISGEHGAVDFFPYIKDPERETAGYNPDSPGCSPYLIK